MKLHLPLGEFHEGDLVEFWSNTQQKWVDAQVQAEQPITGNLHIAFDFPTDKAGRQKVSIVLE